MPTTINLTHVYPYPADLLWQVVTDLDHLKTATQGLIQFKSLPSGQITEGQSLTVEVSLFGKLPYQPYHMEVVALDHSTRSFQSDEMGVGVRSWRHHLNVTETAPNQSRLTELIEIDAGLATPLFAAWARFMYAKRHKPRLKILASLTGSTP